MIFEFVPFDIRLDIPDRNRTEEKLEEFVKSGIIITLEREGYETVQGKLKKASSESERGYALVFQRYPHVIDEVIINPSQIDYCHNCTFKSEGKSHRKFHYKDGTISRFEELSKFLGPFKPKEEK